MKLWKTIVLFLVSNSALFSTAITFLINHTGNPDITNYFLLSLLGVLYVGDFINMVNIWRYKRIVKRLKVNIGVTIMKVMASGVLGMYALQFNFNHICDITSWSAFWDCAGAICTDWKYLLAAFGLISLIILWTVVAIITL
jgi:hypothetical protein